MSPGSAFSVDFSTAGALLSPGVADRGGVASGLGLAEGLEVDVGGVVDCPAAGSVGGTGTATLAGPVTRVVYLIEDADCGGAGRRR